MFQIKTKNKRVCKVISGGSEACFYAYIYILSYGTTQVKKMRGRDEAPLLYYKVSKNSQRVVTIFLFEVWILRVYAIAYGNREGRDWIFFLHESIRCLRVHLVYLVTEIFFFSLSWNKQWFKRRYRCQKVLKLTRIKFHENKVI